MLRLRRKMQHSLRAKHSHREEYSHRRVVLAGLGPRSCPACKGTRTMSTCCSSAGGARLWPQAPETALCGCVLCQCRLWGSLWVPDGGFKPCRVLLMACACVHNACLDPCCLSPLVPMGLAHGHGSRLPCRKDEPVTCAAALALQVIRLRLPTNSHRIHASVQRPGRCPLSPPACPVVH